MIEWAGHAARLCSNVAARQACWIVVKRAGSCLGSVNFASLNQASEPTGFFGYSILNFSEFPFERLAAPGVATDSFGLKARFWQLPTWNRDASAAVWPSVETSSPVAAIG